MVVQWLDPMQAYAATDTAASVSILVERGHCPMLNAGCWRARHRLLQSRMSLTAIDRELSCSLHIIPDASLDAGRAFGCSRAGILLAWSVMQLRPFHELTVLSGRDCCAGSRLAIDRFTRSRPARDATRV